LIHIALGWDWGGRKVKQGPVIFIAAEAAQGLKKRKVGWTKAHKDDSPGGLPGDVPFYLIEVAPNLGTGQDDLNALIAHIEAEGIRPAAIAIDTVSQTLYGADENGAGMANFISNAHALSNHFDCLVAPVHHVGLADDKRPRGYSGLVPAVDASNLCESSENKLRSTMEVMKLKEEESKQKFSVHFARVVIGKDEDGEEVSTLFVQSVETGAVGCGKPPQQKSIPRTQRLLISIVAQALGEDETAKIIRPFNDGPLVKAVSDEAVRRR
jgi:AAA domain